MQLSIWKWRIIINLYIKLINYTSPQLIHNIVQYIPNYTTGCMYSALHRIWKGFYQGLTSEERLKTHYVIVSITQTLVFIRQTRTSRCVLMVKTNYVNVHETCRFCFLILWFLHFALFYLTRDYNLDLYVWMRIFLPPPRLSPHCTRYRWTDFFRECDTKRICRRKKISNYIYIITYHLRNISGQLRKCPKIKFVVRNIWLQCI